MKNLLSFFLIFFLVFLISCSFDNKTGVWKEHNKKIIDKVKNDINEDKTKILCKKEKTS